MLLNKGNTTRALVAFRKAFTLGEAAIPHGYSGLIEWSHDDNRPFLRAAYGVVLCQLRLNEWRPAIENLERLLAWNPLDFQGARCLLGPALLRAGRQNEARNPLKKNRDVDPSHHYELTLMDLLNGEYRAAATHLRHGFIRNPYIAETLCGMSYPLPITMWHGSTLEEPVSAINYKGIFGGLWTSTRGAVAFLRWLNSHPKILAERAAILECCEMMLWERDDMKLRTIHDRRNMLENSIDDHLSARLVAKRTDRHGNEDWPWQHIATRQWLARPPWRLSCSTAVGIVVVRRVRPGLTADTVSCVAA